ncbi:MAG: phenylalanine--tRNA ligase subunit beta, partial [Oscillospiraceae bacterium]|nr:phenylalanine--tRNA ligase subunit beta [Oscillospiraceae bacterium]
MNLSLNWLNDYVAIDKISLPDMVSGLTMSGSKVEKAKDLSEPLCKIVVGKVAQIKKHEDSDKLWICQLDVGGREVQIVTGAQNVTEGSIVPVVLDGGTVLNRQDGSVTKIKKGKLRGEVSEGMLCSPDELGLDKSDVPYADEDGILILSNDPERSKLQVGGNALEFLGLSDTVLEFEITNNRPDCFSVTGLAREVAATFDLPLDVPAPHYKGINHDINSEVRVTVENSELCSRYMAGFAKNVKIAPSPRWLTSRLKAHGIRPINNIVDITNYVMLEYGHPLHAFDKRQVEDGQIIVRNAAKHEQITLLDGNTVTLDTDTLVIADASKPMAVAGVMGGEFSGVADDTTEVIFEAACFDGVSVRRASKKIGRRTESSSRFEKGLNPVNVKAALLRALQLVEELGIGEVADTNIDVQHFTETKSLVSHDCDFVNKSLGANISQEEQIAIFRRLGLGYEDGNVIVPSHRSDINLPCDLVEEVARIYGYNNIAPTLPPNAVKGLYEHSVRKIADVLTAQGCNECITYSFVSPRMTSGDMVGIRNPFGEETSVMRTSLWASMLKVIGDNLNAGNTEGRLFELGRTYAPDGETDKLCIGLYGKDEDY